MFCVALLLSLCLCGVTSGFVQKQPDDGAVLLTMDTDPKEAQRRTAVKGLAGVKGPTYAGYLTINTTTDSNMFFWFFPMQQPPATKAPLLLWLQGGPGGSSLFGLFNEHGPFVVNKDIKLEPRGKYAWTDKYSMLYIDNPVGTGFSFTGKEEGYVTNETQVARDLYSALQVFFKSFPEYNQTDFYVTGESYAGKYVPAIAYKIHEENAKPNSTKINFKGMAIGDGLCDPINMLKYGEYLYEIGLISKNQKTEFQRGQGKVKSLITSGKFEKAFEAFDELLNGDLTPYPSLFFNYTGSKNYYNFLLTSEPEEFSYYIKYIAKPEVRANLNVGDHIFNDGKAVEKHLKGDVMNTVKGKVEKILDAGYKVMLYSGQLDIIVAYPLSLNFISKLDWKGAKEYNNNTTRHIWKINKDGKDDVAGYITQTQNLQVVLVRNAGHMVPYDQPLYAFDLISRFVDGKPFFST